MVAIKSRNTEQSLFRVRRALGTFGALMMLSAPLLSAPRDEPVVILSQTLSELKPYAIAPGQRLHTPGRETITASGSLTLFEDGRQRTEAVHILWQLPMKVRVKREGAPLVFDRNNPEQTMSGAQKTIDVIQTLLEDSVEGLFALQKERISLRYLGSGFKLEGAGESDPGMDVVMVTYSDKFHSGQPILKSYWFDSSTKLLGVVAYTSASGAATHVVVGDWRDVSGEKIPFRVERWEDNKPAMRLILESAAVSAKANDDTFGGN